MKKIIKKLIIFNLIFLISLSNYLSLIQFNNNIIETKIQDKSKLKNSNPGKSLLHTYNFENDIVGQNPTGITLSVNDPIDSGTTRIDNLGDEQQNHVALNKSGGSKSIRLEDNLSYYGYNYDIGELHFKFYHDNSLFGIHMRDSAGTLFAIDLWEGNVGRYDITTYTTYILNQWIDFTFFYNISLGWMFEIDGMRFGDGYSYSFEHGSPTGIEEVHWGSAYSGGGNGFLRIDDITFYYETENLINLYTPESKDYKKGMSGYYPATYGFEDILNGDFPTNWDPIGIFDGNSYINISGSKDGHYKIMEVKKHGGVAASAAYTTFKTNASWGTIEFWLYKDTDGGTDGTKIDIKGEGGDIRLIVENQDLFHGSYGSRVLIASDVFKINTWYHIRINFDISQGGWQIQLDETYYGFGYSIPFTNNPTEFWGFVIASHFSGCHPDYTAWLDALDYSWNPYYNIGDNMYEGLLLSYNNNTKLEWQGYSLDSQQNKTILGNITIPMPEEGLHTIQVFGNDTIGTMHHSDIRYFTVDFPIDIITPEAKIYNKAMDGYYPATYGFEDTLNGYDPINWADNLNNWKIIEEFNGHRKVFNCYQNRANTNQNWTIGLQDNGTVEFWVAVEISDVGPGPIQCRLSGFNPTCQISVGSANGHFWYADDTGWHEMSLTAINNQWYHIRIDFECTNGGYFGLGQYEWYFYINGRQFGPYTFAYNETPYRFNCWSNDYGINRYLDAIGYSWDPNYNISDNLYEGLLLSFQNSTKLNWTRYSLDHQPVKTISGNTTFPIPEDGLHTIQVFGNDTFGTDYQSDIRYFTINIDLIAPNIQINSPTFNDLFGNTAPNFNITITEPNLDSMWYTIDGGLTNITIDEPTGIINQSEWNDRPNGTVIIRFYANDTVKNMGFEEIAVRKDILPPEITINSPYHNQVFRNRAPYFDLFVDERNLNLIWYTLDNGLVNITCGTSGQINQDLWNALKPGNYILRFYASDMMGNEGFSEISIKKGEQAISLANPVIILLISVLGILVIVLRIKRRIKINNN